MSRLADIPYRGWLLAAFLVLFPLSCINAESPPDLLLQHTPTVILLVALIWTGFRHPLSNLSYTLLFVYLLLHLVGARHLYSYVPYDDWTEQLVGVRLADIFGFRRNHYDRLVHLCFGLLLLIPAHELVVRLMKIRGAWSIVVAVWLIIVFSTLYELLEWGVAMVMSPDATERYNGQQGDVWDAHRDTALATGGAVFSALLLALDNCRRAVAPGRLKVVLVRALPISLACSVAALGGCQTTETHQALTPSTVASYGTQYSGPKYKTAIGNVENRAAFMNGLFFDNDLLGSQMEQNLKTHLAQSGRFDVMDRVNMEALALEAKLSQRPQSLIGASIIITGAVTEFGRKEVGAKGLGGLLSKSRTQIAYAKVSITVVDVASSRALYTVQGAGEFELRNSEILGFGSTAPYDATLTDKVLNLAVIEAVNKLVNSLDHRAWAPGAKP